MFKLKLVIGGAVIILIVGLVLLLGRSAKQSVDIITIAVDWTKTAKLITVQGNYEGTFEPMIGTWFPGIKKHLFITTRGTISLGIDCKRVRVNEYRTDTLFLTMPSVKVIAHEFEFTKISDLSWWKTTVQEIPKLMDSCKTEIEYNIRKNGAAFALAEIATEEAFRNYDPRLKNIPLVFKWDEPVEDIDEKKDTPFKIKWNRL